MQWTWDSYPRIAQRSEPFFRTHPTYSSMRCFSDYVQQSVSIHFHETLDSKGSSDGHFEFGSRSRKNICQCGCPGRQYTRAITSGPVRWKFPNWSELGQMSAGRPARPSIDSYTAFVFAVCNSILSKLCFQQPIIRFCIFCSLQYQLISNRCCTFDIWYFCLSEWSIIPLWARRSTRCHDYQICKTWSFWRSVNAHFQDAARSMALSYLAVNPANIS